MQISDIEFNFSNEDNENRLENMQSELMPSQNKISNEQELEMKLS